jgi:hypothetical protein
MLLTRLRRLEGSVQPRRRPSPAVDHDTMGRLQAELGLPLRRDVRPEVYSEAKRRLLDLQAAIRATSDINQQRELVNRFRLWAEQQ